MVPIFQRITYVIWISDDLRICTFNRSIQCCVRFPFWPLLSSQTLIGIPIAWAREYRNIHIHYGHRIYPGRIYLAMAQELACMNEQCMRQVDGCRCTTQDELCRHFRDARWLMHNISKLIYLSQYVREWIRELDGWYTQPTNNIDDGTDGTQQYHISELICHYVIHNGKFVGVPEVTNELRTNAEGVTRKSSSKNSIAHRMKSSWKKVTHSW